MKERTIKLTMIDGTRGAMNAHRQTFLISLSAETGAEIRFERAAIASRDRSIETTVGIKPDPTEITLSVEEMP